MTKRPYIISLCLTHILTRGGFFFFNCSSSNVIPCGTALPISNFMFPVPQNNGGQSTEWKATSVPQSYSEGLPPSSPRALSSFCCFHLQPEKSNFKAQGLISGVRKGEKLHADSPRQNASLLQKLGPHQDIKNQMRGIYLQRLQGAADSKHSGTWRLIHQLSQGTRIKYLQADYILLPILTMNTLQSTKGLQSWTIFSVTLPQKGHEFSNMFSCALHSFNKWISKFHVVLS